MLGLGVVRRGVANALVVGLALVVAAPASAAHFSGTPYPYTQSGAGPFSWGIESDSPGGPKGSFAYKLSTESAWHRCGMDGYPTLSNLPEGTYTVSIADDISLDYYGARGLGASSFTAPCFDTTLRNPPIPSAQSTLYVDATPPAVSAPTVLSSGKTVRASAAIGDANSGVKSVTWNTGDGGVFFNIPSFTWTYLNYGTWPASVSVTDYANNTTTAAFTVALSAPPTTPTRSATVPPSNSGAARDVVAPLPSRTRVATGSVLQRRTLNVAITVSEQCVATLDAQVRIAGHSYRFSGATRTLKPVGATSVHLTTNRALRAALRRAVGRHEHPKATVRIRLTDAAGNTARYSRSARLAN